jgi:hypothetical protein
VTTITPRAAGEQITDSNAFDSGMISQL